MISITITNVYCQILGLTDMRVIDILDHKLSYFVSGYNFTFAFKQHRWDGRKRLLTEQLKFQTGLLPIVEEVLRKNNVKYELNDTRQDVVLGKEIVLNPNYYTLRDYQVDIVNVCLKEKCGLVKAATGAGKTASIAALIAKLNIKTVVYVISLDLLYQTKKGIEDAIGQECGIIGDGLCIIKKITIATPWSVNTAYDKNYDPFDDEEGKVRPEKLDQLSKIKIQKMVENAQCYIFDEVQHLAADSFQLIAKSSKAARYKLGFSASPWRDDGQDLALTAATGPQLIDIDATTLINRGVLVPPKIFFFDVPELPGFEKDSKQPYQKVYEHYIVENETRNNMIIESATKLFDKGRKTLILIKRKKHGLKLLEMMPKNIRSYFLDGDASSDERQTVKDLFNNGGVDIVLSTSIFDQGVDLPMLDALILGGSGKSSTRALQRLGRVIRGFPGKKDSLIVDFVDNALYLFSHSRKRHAIYKTEPAFQIKLPEHIDW